MDRLLDHDSGTENPPNLMIASKIMATIGASLRIKFLAIRASIC